MTAARVPPRTKRETGAGGRAWPSRQERGIEAWTGPMVVFTRWFPYPALGLSVLLSLVLGGEDPVNPWSVLVLAGCAALWVLAMHTTAPTERLSRPFPMTAYYTGLLALATLLMLQHPFFFVFTITGFLHAGTVRSRSLVLGFIGATSLVINIAPYGSVPTSPTDVLVPGTIIVVQTMAIWLGYLGQEVVMRENRQRRAAVAELEAALEENAGLHAQLLAQAREAGVLDERQRMAREIHDTIAQGLTGIIVQIHAAQQARASGGDWERHLETADRLARENLDEARRSVNALRPQPLEEVHLLEGLRVLVEEWADRHGVPATFHSTGEAHPLHPEIEVTLLRITQESLANVATHARASRVGVTLSYMGDLVTLDVRDDGTGFDTGLDREAAQNGGHGLRGMRQRASRVAGRLEVESQPGAGTAIFASVPAIPLEVERA